MRRWEHIEWNLSTEACDMLQTLIECNLGFHAEHLSEYARNELVGCANELGARLQRRDQDPHVPREFIAREAAKDDPLLA